MDPLVQEIGSRPVAFVDDALIDASKGLERRAHQLKKVSAGPVLRSTQAWEGAWTAPVGVAFDAGIGLWRMWYVSTSTRGVQIPGSRRGTLHLAVSADGLSWDKRPLGLCAIGADNNLCAWEDGSPVGGAVCVLDEPDDPDPAQRYKLVQYRPNYHLAYSADGLRWRPAQDWPVWSNGAGDGLEETCSFFRDPLSGKYRGYMRVWRRHQTIRKVALGESDDLRSWTGPRICWEAPPEMGVGAQIYGMHVHVDAGLYWGFPWVFFGDEPLEEELEQTIRLRLGWSRDGTNWHAMSPSTDVVPMGQRPTSFDWGMMIAGPIVMGEHENRLYYVGCNGAHSAQVNRRYDGAGSLRAVGMATWRRGGLVSLHAAGEGSLVTRRFVFRGRELRLNAAVAPGGSIVAALLDDSGNTIEPFTFDASDPFAGDAVDHALSWRGRNDLSHLQGQYVRLKLRLRKADLFTFRLHGEPERFAAPLGPPPVRCGRCAVAPTIDGRLDEGCWQDFTHSGVAADFVRFDRIEPAAVQTRALFTYDDRCLYIALECDEPAVERLAGKPGRDVDYAVEDCFEVRLSSPAHGFHVHQLMVSAVGGTTHNRFSKEAGELRPDIRLPWQVKTSAVTGRWVAEIAVPFSTLDTKPPGPGERWRLNIIRYRHTQGVDRSAWVCVFGSVHRSDLAGELLFC